MVTTDTQPCISLNLSDQMKGVVQKNLKLIQNFEYIDDQGNKLIGWNAYGPIGELMTWKQGYELDKIQQGVDWMQKTFALLLSYSPEEEIIDLTFTPTADQCFHAFLQINPLWKQFEAHIGREIYHYPFLIGDGLKKVRNITSELFLFHFSEDPFQLEEATSCSSCCLSPNPPLPVPDNW